MPPPSLPADTLLEVSPVDGSERALLRPFTRDDVPAVAAMRRRIFQVSRQSTDDALRRYLARTFLDDPWRDLDLPSWVHLDAAGEVNGFLGIVPRRMRWRRREIRVAVPTQLMVVPGASPGAGTRLARHLFNGPQDLTFSDAANDAARRLWSRVGGSVAVVPSLHYVLPIRPVRLAFGRHARRPMGRILAALGRPLAALLDHPRRPRPIAGPVRAEPIDLPRHLPLLEAILATWPLAPRYDPSGLRRQVDEVQSRREQGPLVGHLVRDLDGKAVGWYWYHANEGGVGEIVQIGARPGEQGRILAPLILDAYRRGVIGLAGRLEHGLVEPLSARAVPFTRDGPWVLTHARDPELLAAVLAGAGAFSRLDGEWWLNF